MTIILEIPTTYTAHVIPPGCSAPRDVGIRCLTPMSFPEVSGGDVAVAARFTPPQQGRFANTAYRAVEYRSNPQGGLLVLAQDCHAHANGINLINLDGNCGAASLAAALAANVAMFRRANRGNMVYSPFQALPNVEQWMDQGEPVRRMFHTDRDARLVELRANLRGACFIDGQFFVPDPGPSLHVHKVYQPQRRYDIVARSSYSPHILHFRGDRLEDALAMAAVLNDDECPGMVAQQHGHIEVLDAAAFGIDDDWLALRHHVEGYIEATASRLHAREYRDVESWFRLRDSLRRGWPQRYDAGLHALVTADAVHVDTDNPNVLATRTSLERVEQTQRRLALFADLVGFVDNQHEPPLAGPGMP